MTYASLLELAGMATEPARSFSLGRQDLPRGGSPVRGRQDHQVTMLAFIDLGSRVPPDHPLRAIKALADQALTRLSFEFDLM